MSDYIKISEKESCGELGPVTILKAGCIDAYSPGNLYVDSSTYKFNSQGEIRTLKQNSLLGWSEKVCIKVSRTHYDDIF